MKARKGVVNCGTGFNNAGGSYMYSPFGNKPTGTHVMLIPKNMNKPFWERFKEWWK